MLCTKDDLKERLTEIDGTEYDDMLDSIIGGVSALADTFTGRTLIVTAADVTEYAAGRCEYLQLERYPVVAITSIKEAMDFDFDNATALVADTDYRLIKSGRSGICKRLYMDWIKEDDGIQIIYRGGYTAAGDTPGTGETAVPSDLREAAIQQCCFIFKRRDDIGLASVSFDGGSFQKFSAMKLLPGVESTLNAYRRVSL